MPKPPEWKVRLLGNVASRKDYAAWGVVPVVQSRSTASDPFGLGCPRASRPRSSTTRSRLSFDRLFAGDLTGVPVGSSRGHGPGVARGAR